MSCLCPGLGGHRHDALSVFSLRSSLAMARSGATVRILTSNHSSDPAGSMMWASARWMGRTLRGTGCPSGKN